MEEALGRLLGSQAQHTQSLEDHAWSIQQSTTTHTKHIHNIQQQNSNYTQAHCGLFHRTIHKHCQARGTQNKQTHWQSNTRHARIQHHTHYFSSPRGYKKIYSQGPHKLNIRHLKHICPLGLAFLTSMFEAALDKNIIPHTWKLANIVHIPKPNKDIDKGTSYRLISLLSVISKTLEKILLPYMAADMPNAPMQHGCKPRHSTVTALHTLNNIVAGVQPDGSPCANNHCSTRYEQSFWHNKHTHTNQKAATYKHSRHNR